MPSRASETKRTGTNVLLCAFTSDIYAQVLDCDIVNIHKFIYVKPGFPAAYFAIIINPIDRNLISSYDVPEKPCMMVSTAFKHKQIVYAVSAPVKCYEEFIYGCPFLPNLFKIRMYDSFVVIYSGKTYSA